MIYRGLVTLLMGLMIAASAHATTPSAVIKRIGSSAFVMGNFEQKKQLQGVAYPLQANGHFLFWQSQGLYLHTETPFFNAFTVAQDGLIHWDAQGVGRVANEQSALFQREFNKTLLAFFRADLALIEQRFTATWSFNEAGWVLVLEPKLAVIKNVMTRVELSGSALLDAMTVVGANGDTTQLSFSDQQIAEGPTAAQCRWFFLTPEASCASLATSH